MLTNGSSANISTDPSVTGNSLAMTIGLTLGYVVAIIGGTLGNALVILVVLFNRSMHSTTNFFISSLAAADLIVTSVCMPLFFVYNVLTWPMWPFGRTGCRVLSYLVHVSVMASALSLLSISYDRCLTIFFPFKRLVTLSRAKKAIGVIWLVSPLLLLPSLFHHDVVSSENGGKTAVMCVESWGTTQQLHAYQLYRVSFYFLFVALITVVYCLIGTSLYRREHPGEQTSRDREKALFSKRKIIRMLFLVVALFSLSWLPYIINKLLNIFPPEPNFKSPDFFVFVGNFLALLNSVANPVVYAVLNQNYRTGFRYAIRCKFNFEKEERRRILSVSLKNASSFSRAQSRKYQRDADRRRTSSLSTEIPRDEDDNGPQPIICLSFVKNMDIGLQDLANTVTNNSSSNGLGRRRVSFGGEHFACAEKNQENGHIEGGEIVACAIKEEEFEDQFTITRSCKSESSSSAGGGEDEAHVNKSYEVDI